MFEIRDTPLDLAEVMEAVAHDGAGAIDVFVGRVRNRDGGRDVTRLEYQAYPSMAEAEMRRIAEEIAAEIPDVRLAVQHRVGSLEVGEPAIVAAASAPHRAEAFAATRLLVDRIKARVPIWKRQFGPDGADWVGWEDARCADHGDSAHGGHAHHDHAHHDHAHHDHAHHDHAHMEKAARVAVITISDTRGPDDDPSGDLLAELLAAGGHAVVARRHVRDEPDEIRAAVRELAEEADAVVTTGGTGITARDRTPEALEPILDRVLEGFGEAFRALSFDEIGPRAVLSRALAGVAGRTLVFALPGSRGAVRLAAERLLVPLLGHARVMVEG